MQAIQPPADPATFASIPKPQAPRLGMLVVKVAALMAASEFGVMLLVTSLHLDLSGWELALLDSVLLTAVVAPIGYLGLVRRDARRLRTTMRTLESARDDAEQLARLDGLTGVLGRRGLTEVLEHEWQRARRYGHPLSCMMIDLDDFKTINDEHGHPAGDRLLQEVTRALLGIRRVSDHVGRYGGDEFMILLPETDLAGATVMAERIRATVAATRIAVEGGAVGTAVSIGVAEGVGPDAAASDLIERADRALLAAKRAGRDRVVSEVTAGEARGSV